MNDEQSKPLIQIDDEIREMTDEEYAIYLERQSFSFQFPSVINE